MAQIEKETPREYKTLTEDEMAYILAVYKDGKKPKKQYDWREYAPKYHFTELPPLVAHDPLAASWDVYRREVSRLLAEGSAGKFIAIRGTEIVGFWGTFADAQAECDRLFPGERVMIQEVMEYHPFLRSGYSKLCRD